MRIPQVAGATALLLFTVAACADPDALPAGGDAPPDETVAEFERRAEQIGSLWRDAAESAVWHEGLLLLEPPTVTPEPRDDETSGALHAGWLRTDLEWDTVAPADGEVRFADGEVRPVPLISVAQAWGAVHQPAPECPDDTPSGRPDARGGSPRPGDDGAASPRPGGDDPDDPVSSGPLPCVVLTVTDARLDVVTVATSRGPAEVPAWLFAVAELDEPVARVAVSPSEITDVPRLEGVTSTHGPGLATAMGLSRIEQEQVSFDLGIGACDVDATPLVFETDEVVVLGGTSRLEPGTMACTDQLVIEEVSATLDEPVGTRPVFALTGEVLTFGRW